MEEFEEKTEEIWKVKKNKAEKDEVNRLKQALSNKEQELCKKDNFEQDMVMVVLGEKENENARIHAELYNMQNGLVRFGSVENEIRRFPYMLRSRETQFKQKNMTNVTCFHG